MEKKQALYGDGTANPLGTDPILGLLLKYAVPSIVSMVVMSLYNIVDQLFIGRGVGFLGNGATTVAFPVITAGLAVALLMGNGAAAFISLELGRGNVDKANRALGNTITLTVGAGLFMAIYGLLSLEPLLYWMGCPDAVLLYAKEYTGIILIGMPFAMLSPAISNIIRADGSPRYSMFATLAGAALNTILDPIFIFVFQMGVRGAAIATVISQIVSAVLVLDYALRRGKLVRFEARNLNPDWRVAWKTLALGLSSFTNQMCIVITSIVRNHALVVYGALSVYGSEVPLSAMGIIVKINAIFISIVLGISIGAQPILGFNYGAKNFERVRRVYKAEVTFATIFSGIACLLFVTAPHIFIRAFGDSDPVFNEFAVRAMRVFLCLVFTAGIQIPSAGYFQAIGKPLKAMTLTMSRSLVFLLLFTVTLPGSFGLDGVLYAQPATDVAALLVTLAFIVPELRRLGEGGDALSKAGPPMAENR